MPFPFIVWGVVAAGCAVVGVVSTALAAGRINDAKNKYDSRRKRYEEAMQQCEKKHRYASEQFENLGKTRLEAVVTLGKAVAFLEKAKLKDRELFEKYNITPEQLVEWRTASVHAVEILGGVASSALSGVATSAAVYGLVGTLGSAGTGAAIGTLSGAAATNATLAWLGGGTIAAGGGGVAAGTVVLGGLVVGPAILVASFFAHLKAGDIENKVERNIAEMDIDEANKWKLVGALEAVLARVSEMKETTLKVQGELEELLSISTPDFEKDAYMVAKVAVSLGQLLEIAILDKEGKIV